MTRRPEVLFAGLGALVAGAVAFHETGRPGAVLAAAVVAGAAAFVLLTLRDRLGVRDLRRAALYSAAAALAVGAVTMAAVGARRADARVAVVQLWVVPAGKGAVEVGVDTLHSKPASYRVVLSGGARRVWRLRLDGSAHWHATVRLRRGTAVVAGLYRGTGAIRRVSARIA